MRQVFMNNVHKCRKESIKRKEHGHGFTLFLSTGRIILEADSIHAVSEQRKIRSLFIYGGISLCTEKNIALNNLFTSRSLVWESLHS